jgi:predicted SnoaL-like aldol condensation-catalyzing enzyme
MSTDGNKAVVRRFITEVLSGGNLDLADELLAPNYANDLYGSTDVDSFKAGFAGLRAALPNRRFDIEDLIAEGDAVVARWTAEVTHASGKAISLRGLTYYRLADGKIEEDDPITTPDLMQEIGKLAPVPVSS